MNVRTVDCISYLLRSHILEVLSMDALATKSPDACHETPQTAQKKKKNRVTSEHVFMKNFMLMNNKQTNK